jgi:hypothetical protein
MSEAENSHNESRPLRMPWHPPEFYVLELPSTAHQQLNTADNPGHESTHS